MRFIVVAVLAMSCTFAQSSVPPIPPVRSVAPMGTVTQNAIIQGRDGTASAVYNGKSLWIFGDTTLTRDNGAGKNFIDNSMSWATSLDASNGITLNGDHVDSTGAPVEVVPFLPWEEQYNKDHDSGNCQAAPCGAEFAIWGGQIVPDPARGRALIFYSEIWRIPGQAGWKTVGTGIAILKNGKITRPIVNPGSQLSTLSWTGSQTGYTSGWLTIADTLYAYGCYPGFLVQNCSVGRVALEKATTPAAWTYYTASGDWSSNPEDAVTLFQGGAAGNSIFYDKYIGLYVAIYNGVFSNDVFYRVAYAPWGPWSDQTYIFTGLPGYQNNVDYAALAHPEFAQNDGRTQYITYVQTTGFLAQVIQLVKIEF